jgi:hypothetical protein
MSNKRISELPSATVPLAGSELVAIVQSNETRQVSVANMTPHIIAGENILVNNTNPMQPEITALTYCTNTITTGFNGLGYYTKVLNLDYISNINPCTAGQQGAFGFGGSVNVFQDPLLENVSFANLKAVYTAGIKIASNPLLETINFPKLEKIVLQGGSLPSVSYSDFLGIGISQCPLTEINFPNLKYLSSIYLVALDAVQQIDLPSLESNEDTPIYYFIIVATATQSINISSLKRVKYCQVTQNPNLQTLDISSITAFVGPQAGNAGVNISSNSALTEIIMPTALTSDSAVYFGFNSNALSQTSVDTILAKCVSYSVAGGTLDLGGGTNASPTGGTANLNYISLTNNGWTVTINP